MLHNFSTFYLEWKHAKDLGDHFHCSHVRASEFNKWKTQYCFNNLPAKLLQVDWNWNENRKLIVNFFDLNLFVNKTFDSTKWKFLLSQCQIRSRSKSLLKFHEILFRLTTNANIFHLFEFETFVDSYVFFFFRFLLAKCTNISSGGFLENNFSTDLWFLLWH